MEYHKRSANGSADCCVSRVFRSWPQTMAALRQTHPLAYPQHHERLLRQGLDQPS